MGQKAQVLLVMIGLLLAGSVPAEQLRINAAGQSAFWLWSGVKTSADMSSAQTVYLHQGEILTSRQGARFIPLGLPVSPLTFPELWITIRLETLDIPDEHLTRIVQLLQRWQAAGNNVKGLQLDFDAATYRLDSYGEFLNRMRANLPGEYQLSITGLLDWARTGQVAVINQLPVDEVVIQSYQGRKTVSGFEQYLPALNQLKKPFKIGVVQNGIWNIESEILFNQSSYYQGKVVFLLNPKRTPGF